MPTLLKLDNFSVHRNEIVLFDPLSLILKGGQAFEIRGQNGIGKTSLLEIIAGLNTQFKGGCSLFAPSLYISQKPPFNPEETLLENLFFWASFWDVSALLSTALQEWSIKHLSHLPYKHLSQGQKQRANLARLTLKQAPLWLLDEPTATLDQKSIKIFQTNLKKHLHKGGGAFIATHQPLNLNHLIVLEPYFSEAAA